MAFIGRTVLGVESADGRKWTIFVPANVLQKRFGGPTPTPAAFDEWVQEEGAAVFARAFARASASDEGRRAVFVHEDDL